MSEQIIKQPNDLYCVWSTIVDDITGYNMTRDELVEDRVQGTRTLIEADIDRKLEQLERGENPYFQFTMTYEEVFEQVAECHDQAAADTLRAAIEKPSESADG